MSNSSSPSATNSKRSRAANKIISFAGLGSSGKTSVPNSSFGSSTFPTFRFSPESDEVQEVLSSSVTYLPDDGGCRLEESSSSINGVTPLSESLPSSPKPGETSPIKEYIRKNWTNKWDKKSLSLDLDLRGKIKTAIEDKRKSIVSHFIPEEGAPIPQPPVIPEHTGRETTTNAGSIFSYDPTTQSISSNLTQSAKTDSLSRQEYEEIGVDFLACLEQESTLDDQLSKDKVDLSLLSWSYPPSALVEKFEGVLATVVPQPTDDTSNIGDPEPLSVSQICVNFSSKLLEHSLTKVCVGFLAAAIFLPVHSFFMACLTFGAGILCAVILSQTFSETLVSNDTLREVVQETSRSLTPPGNSGDFAETKLPVKVLQLSPKCQGWMLEFDGAYNPLVTTFHSTDSAFIHLDASLLYISTPSSKHRITKRKLWSDPSFTHDVKFIRHRVFNLAGAQVFIAPDKLASRRVWNKKYPIGIRLAPHSHSWGVARSFEPISTVTSPADSSGEYGILSKEQIGTPSQPLLRKRKSSTNLCKGDKEFSRKSSDGKVLYLFSRTCREKEDWFRRLVNASKMNGPTTTSKVDVDDYLQYMANILPNFESALREGKQEEADVKATKLKNSTSVESEDSVAADGGVTSVRSSPILDLVEIASVLRLTATESPAFFNALLGRLLYDAVRSPYWSLQLQNRIQRKLNFVRRPPFLELLIVKDVDLGGSIPVIQRTTSPIIDARGLWVDLEITYEGAFCLTLETKINLLKLRRSPTGLEDDCASAEDFGANVEYDSSSGNAEGVLVGNLYDSDAEDSGESSEEEFDHEAFLKHSEELDGSDSGTTQGSNETGVGTSQQSKRVKLLKMVEKVATSNFVSEMKMVKSAIDRVANTAICLTVEVKELTGTISVNIPAPPTNRVWMGFRTKPEMKLVTTPKVGERHVNLNPLTDWIQRKIHQQIQRTFVLPNMDDITINLMEFKLPS